MTTTTTTDHADQMERLRASWGADIDRLDGLDHQLSALRKSCRGWLQQLDLLIQRTAHLEREIAERNELIAHQASDLLQQSSDIARLQSEIDRLLAERLTLVRPLGGES